LRGALVAGELVGRTNNGFNRGGRHFERSSMNGQCCRRKMVSKGSWAYTYICTCAWICPAQDLPFKSPGYGNLAILPIFPLIGLDDILPRHTLLRVTVTSGEPPLHRKVSPHFLM
jgi:hypothetical protein